MKGCKSWLLAVSLCAPLAAQAAEPESCASVRFADVGWTDITVTTAVTRQVLESLGYKTKVNLLSVPVTTAPWPTTTSTYSWATGCPP